MPFAATLRKPITFVLVAAIAGAICVFRNYGQTWDEPLFYGYADALGYAYSPVNWFSGHFDLSQSYGPSAEDHKTRGPGYLLLARFPAQLLQGAGLSTEDSWHLLNSLTFILAVYFVFAIASRAATEMPAAVAAALFATQPMLWGHAFINPKDVPFMAFFAGAVCLGWRMVDRFTTDQGRPQRLGWFGRIALPAAVLGVATSNRVLGPLAGLLVAAYWLARRPQRQTVAWMGAYALMAGLVVFVTWPYLWESPRNFIEAFSLMANNPTVLPVLFGGQVYAADSLPLRYLPVYLSTTLTEPVWPLAAIGSMALWLRGDKTSASRLLLGLLLSWMLVPCFYVLLRRPPIYDGMRHFLFMLPPAFVLGAAGMEAGLRHLRPLWLKIALVMAIVIPGVLGIAVLHPYEYTYFNSIVGGTRGAFRQFETDYWLTCYREAVQDLQEAEPGPKRVFVHREAAVAAPYADQNTIIADERGQRTTIGPGDYILVNSRTNEDLHDYRDAPIVLSVSRMGATYCFVKRVQ